MALRIVDAFVRACEERGFDLQPNPNRGSDDGVSVWFDGESIPLRLFEGGRSTPKLTLEFRHEAYSYHLAQRSWGDNTRSPLTGKLNEVMLAMRAEVAKRVEARLRDEERARRMDDLMRKRTELHERIESEEERVAALRVKADDWRHAQNIRAYVAIVPRGVV